MVLLTITVVILRYVFAIGAIPLQESIMYMHGILFLTGIPYGIYKNTHVRVDIFYAQMKSTRKGLVDLCGHTLFLIPISTFILITSWPYTLASWRVLEGSAEVGGIPAVFLLKTLVPAAALLMLLHKLKGMAGRHRCHRAGHPDRAPVSSPFVSLSRWNVYETSQPFRHRWHLPRMRMCVSNLLLPRS